MLDQFIGPTTYDQGPGFEPVPEIKMQPLRPYWTRSRWCAIQQIIWKRLKGALLDMIKELTHLTAYSTYCLNHLTQHKAFPMKEEWAKDSIHMPAIIPEHPNESPNRVLNCFFWDTISSNASSRMTGIQGLATMEPGRHPSCWNAVAPHNDPLPSEGISWAESLSMLTTARSIHHNYFFIFLYLNHSKAH